MVGLYLWHDFVAVESQVTEDIWKGELQEGHNGLPSVLYVVRCFGENYGSGECIRVETWDPIRQFERRRVRRSLRDLKLSIIVRGAV